MYEGVYMDSAGKTSPFIKDKLRVSLTGECNRHCFYCHNEGQGHADDSRFLPLSFVRDLTDYVKRGGYRIKKVNITGGEPLLHPQADEIIRAFASVADSVRLNTNGSLLSRARIDELVACGVTALKIGVDSFWNEGDGGAIKNADPEEIRRLILYAAGKCKVVLNTVITRYNSHLIDDMIAFCEENHVKRIKINELVDYNFRGEAAYDNADADVFDAYYRKYKEKCARFTPGVDVGMDDMLLPSGLTVRFCASFCKTRACGTMYTIINPLGEIVVCSKSAESVSVDFSRARDPKAITRDIVKARALICNCETNRYLRDARGRKIEADATDGAWAWEKETGDYWHTPEGTVYALARRWQGGALLDLGAGLGRNARAFADAGFQVIAADKSRYAVDFMQKAFAGDPRVACVRADMCKLPFDTASVDFVFAFNSLSHSDTYMLSLAVSEIHRVLKFGAEAYLTLCAKASGAWQNRAYPRIDAHTAIKRKPGPEYGVAHYYADYADIRALFARFTLIRVWEIRDCYYDGASRDGCHYHVLVKKAGDAQE